MRYVNKVVAEGKREYDIPMFVNAWLQQPNHAWPGTYPCGGPLPQVHDIWRAGAPAVDMLAPDLYLQYFDEVVFGSRLAARRKHLASHRICAHSAR